MRCVISRTWRMCGFVMCNDCVKELIGIDAIIVRYYTDLHYYLMDRDKFMFLRVSTIQENDECVRVDDIIKNVNVLVHKYYWVNFDIVMIIMVIGDVGSMFGWLVKDVMWNVIKMMYGS